MRTEDGALIYKCLNEEPDAFGMLVDKYKAGVYAFVYNKLGNFQDAEDVTQETFLEAFKNLRKLKNFDSFAIWLFSIASNLSKGWIRSLSKRPDREFIEDKDPKVLDDPSIELYRDSKISESLNEALESLPDIYRQVLTLHYLGGMSGLDIARTLGISHDTVRQRLLRAREQLKEEMIAMMSQTFQQQKLSASFTFRIVEMLKNIKIHPNSSIKGLPWGLSLGTGLIFAILMFGQHIQINLPDIAMGLPLPSDMKVLKIGEIPVDAVKVSTITSIGNKGDGKGVVPNLKGQENALFMAPQDEGGKWEKKADMLTGRAMFSASDVNGKIYAMGGLIPGIYSAINEEYDPKLDKWTKKADIPTARSCLTTNVVNGKIYAIGGGNGLGLALSVVEEYDPENDVWIKKTPMPSAKFFHSSIVINNKIYVFGGDSGIKNNAQIASLSAYVYDPAIDQWQSLNDIPAEFHIDWCSSVTLDNKIYFFGGINSVVFAMNQNVIVYDLLTKKWEKKSKLLTERAHTVAKLIDGKVYVFGGTDPVKNFISLSNVEVYDIKGDSWEKRPDMSTARGYLTGSMIDNKIYVLGGTTAFPADEWPNDYLSTNEVYTPDKTESNSVNPSGKLPKTWGMLKAK